jgi:hypothetical protein
LARELRFRSKLGFRIFVHANIAPPWATLRVYYRRS